jgi:hypothetical protein
MLGVYRRVRPSRHGPPDQAAKLCRRFRAVRAARQRSWRPALHNSGLGISRLKSPREIGCPRRQRTRPLGVPVGQYVHHGFHVNDVNEDAGGSLAFRAQGGSYEARRLKCGGELQLRPALPAASLVNASRGRPPVPPLAAPLTVHPRPFDQFCRFGRTRLGRSSRCLLSLASARTVIDMSTTVIASARGTFTRIGGLNSSYPDVHISRYGARAQRVGP